MNLRNFLQEDLFGLVKQDLLDAEQPENKLASQRLRLVNLSKAITGIVQNSYDRVAKIKFYLEVIPEILEEIQKSSQEKLPDNDALDVARQFSDFARDSVLEYRSKLQSFPVSPIVQESHLTLSTISSLVFSSASGISKVLNSLEELASYFGLSKLKKSLHIGGLLIDKFNQKGAGFELTPALSYLLYQIFWKRGMQTSSHFLTENEYANNKENTKTIIDGIVYKLLLAYYTFGGIQTLFSICAALLNRTEAMPESENMLVAVYNLMSNLQKESLVLEDLDVDSLDNLFPLKSKNSLENRINYAKQRVPDLSGGQGSSREVFDLGGGKVIKMAKNAIGIQQNSTEYYAGRGKSDILANVYAKADDGSWIVSEKVIPFTNESQFKEKTGFDFLILKWILRNISKYKNFKQALLETIKYFSEDPKNNEYLEQLKNRDTLLFLAKVYLLISKQDLLAKDLAFVDHWGANSTGQAVLLDYGATIAVYNSYQ